MSDWPNTQSRRDHGRVWARQSSVRLIGSFVLATGALRLWLGEWSLEDLIGPALVLAFEPFTEWLIHVHLLHGRPRTLFGRTVDPLAARKHRAHHFRNEHYWFGVTTDLGDRVLRTRPSRDEVAISPTAKNLAASWSD